MIDSLKLSDETATAIVGLAISFETFTDDMPETEKDRLQAAHDTVAYAIDAYVTDGVRSDSDDDDRREAGEQVEAILKVAGVEVNDDDEIDYGKPLTGKRLDKVLDKWDVEIADADDEEEEEEEDEAAFEIDDIIDGYEELTPASRIKAIKKLDLDLDDEDDLKKLEAIADWENEQNKPASRVLSYIEELLGEEEEADEEEEEDEEEEQQQYTKNELGEMGKEDLREVADKLGVEFPKRLTDAGRKRTIDAILEAQENGDEEPEAEAEDEPWEGYDDLSEKKVKASLEEYAEDQDDPLTVDQLDYTINYEESHKNRENLVEWMQDLADEIAGGGEEEEEEEEKSKKKRPKTSKAKAEAEPEETTLTISLNGDKLGEFDAGAVLAVVAAITDMLESGSTKLSVDMS